MRVIRLSEGDTRTIRFLSDRVDARLLADGRRTVVVNVTRTGTFYDPRYGEFEITRDMLLSMVKNFDANVYGQEIALDCAHTPANGAAGFFRRLFLDGNKLRAEIELTEYGVEAISKRGMIYLSADYAEDYRENEAPYKAHGPLLRGAALTPRPVIKHLEPIQLAEDDPDGPPLLVSDRIIKLLTEEHAAMKDKFLKLLAEALAKIEGLSDAVVKQLSAAFALALEPVTEEAKAKLLMEGFVTAGKEAAAQLRGNPNGPIQLSVQAPGLTADDVKKLLSEQRDADRARDKQLAEKRDANVTLFNKLLSDAKVTEGLAADDAKALSSAADLVTADMTDDQVKRLAENQIAIGGRMKAQAKLAAIGYRPTGHVAHISVDDSNAVKALQEDIDKRLGLADRPAAQRFERTGGQLLAVNKAYAEKVLAEFDAMNGPQLHREAQANARATGKMLAAGDSLVSDVAVPAIFERTVIREALYQLVSLQFVDADTVPFASSALIPYSYRDTAAAGRNDTRTYEGQGIKRAGVKQASDTAYPIPQKIAFEVSDELRYLTSNGQLAWDAVAENQRNATRIIAEDTEKMNFDEILRASDEYGTVAVSNESLTQVNGTNTIFALVNFPVVRPRRIYDLQGNQVGSTLYPITVTYGGTPIVEYDGTGTQAAGTYWVMNYNLGEINFVSQVGAAVTPPNATAIVVSYNRVTNIYQFNTDLGSLTAPQKWDDFLYRYGLRKAVIESDRYYNPNFGAMSSTFMTAVEQASQFGANNMRMGTDLQANGNLGRIKDVPNFRATAPGLNMGDIRAVIGERGTTRFRMAKPWSMGELENQKDSNGRFTGKKEAYGDQFVVLHTPTPLKAAYTGMVLYSTAGRVNRAA